MNIETLIFVVAVLLLCAIRFIHLKIQQEKIWKNLQIGANINMLYTDQYSDREYVVSKTVLDKNDKSILLDYGRWITKHDFFDGKDNMEFLSVK